MPIIEQHRYNSPDNLKIMVWSMPENAVNIKTKTKTKKISDIDNKTMTCCCTVNVNGPQPIEFSINKQSVT